MCKSDFHESAWNCAELTDISDIFIGKKSQKFSFFRSWVIRGQSRGNTWFSRLLMVIAQIRKNENLRCIWLIDCLSQVYRLALVSARNMLVTYGPNLSSLAVKIVKSSNRYCSLVRLCSHLKLGTYKVH